jgi:hypothetical protein
MTITMTMTMTMKIKMLFAAIVDDAAAVDDDNVPSADLWRHKGLTQWASCPSLAICP